MSEPDEIGYKIRKCVEVHKLFRTLLTCGTFGLLGWKAIDTFEAIALAAPEQIGNLAKVVEAIALDRWVLGVVSVLTTGAWWIERKGKKRAIREKSRLQRQCEKEETTRSSSGLDENGDTPKETV